MKRPAFQFYPADWRKDLELQSCSIGARGLWWELSCLMHEAEPYGHLTLKGVAMTDKQAAIAVRVEVREYRKLLAELEAAGVPSRTADGIVYSRRMVRDEMVRNNRAAGGKEGGDDGVKGAEHGKKGGRPRNVRGDIEPPSHETENPPSTGEIEAARGVIEPPLKPPPSSASASELQLQKHAVATRGSTARAGDSQGIGEKGLQTNGKGDNWQSIAWVTAAANTLGVPRLGGETDKGFADRVHTTVNARRRAAEADAKRRESH